MKKPDSILATLVELADGPVLYKNILGLCKYYKRSVRQLCKESGVSWSTLWRMNDNHSVGNFTPLFKIEKVFRNWERKANQGSDPTRQ